MTTTFSSSMRYPMPFTRVEIAALGVKHDRLQVLLIRRQENPFKGRWALAGGVLRIDLDADLQAAARRVAKERFQTTNFEVQQFRAVGSSNRDGRGQAGWALSVVYFGFIQGDESELTAGKRVEALEWFDVDQLPSREKMAFDHSLLITELTQWVRMRASMLDYVKGLVPSSFTLTKLQALTEGVTGQRYNKSNFRRKLLDRELVEEVPGVIYRGRNRPAIAYRLRDGALTKGPA